MAQGSGYVQTMGRGGDKGVPMKGEDVAEKGNKWRGGGMRGMVK